MGSYIPQTEEEQARMLAACGAKSMADLYVDVPSEMLIDGPLNLPEPMSEMEVRSAIEALAAKNKVYSTILRGAGAYDHYIPATVGNIISKEEFLTAYTPYQAEISQGVLQSIFEYQTMMCEMTGLDVSNAGVYDGGTAAAESLAMCVERKRTRCIISGTTNPEILAVMRTYCFGSGNELVVVPGKDGLTDKDAIAAALDDTCACVFVQQPNFYGCIEDVATLAEIAHAGGAKLIMSVNPIAAFALSSAAEVGADIAVGEAQPLGMPLGFGGPYLGFMCATKKNMRALPGRIVGQTEDAQGRRAFVLTLQAREQHIRREKAKSNICSNEALCALAAGVYLSTMGPDGIREVASQCYSKAHYLANALCKLPGISLAYEGEFFHEFATICDGSGKAILAALDKQDILGGLPIRLTDGRSALLWCVTEKTSKAVLDTVVETVGKVVA